ncbi:MAG: DUF4388 domain-containing protein [Chloroflexota bacterium]|nr:DUF4388 domain-containing protein [Chloroflexota bacterium]
MTLRGSIEDFPLRSVLDLLAQTNKTGELQLRAGDQVGALGLAGGRVVTAVFGEEEPLFALGAIFALDGAEFEFTPWDDAPPANLEGKLDDLLRQADEAKRKREEARLKAEAERQAALKKAEEEREAARKKAEEEREAERKRMAEIRALIPRDDMPFRLSERAVDQGAVTLTSERWRVVLAVNGERDVNAIALMLHVDHNAALTALAALVRDGVIEATAPPPPPPAYHAPAPQAPAYEAPAAAAPAYEAPPVAHEPPPAAYEPPPAAYEPSPAAYQAPAYEPPASEAPPSEPPTRAFEPAAPTFEPSGDTFAPARQEVPDFTPEPEATPTPEVPAATQDWITPDQAVPAEDWTVTPTDTPISEVAPQWPAPETAAPAQDWITPDKVEPSMDDRLSALSGIFGPAPTEPEAPSAAEPPVSSWAPPTVDQWGTPAQPAPGAERWTKPPAPEPAAPSTDDPWGTPAASTPTPSTWSPPAPAPTPESDAWVAPTGPANSTWSAPAGQDTTSADPWGSPAGAASRIPPLRPAEPGIPPVEEWSAPPAAPPEKKKRGLFGFGREKPAPPPVAGTPLPTAGVTGSRSGMVAALANALIAEYNNGQYGKNRIEERIANLLMRVDEQADPIDRPLPIVDDRIDVEALEREQLADSQALPYLALLVTTIYADAEKTFGKDKAKKGYKAAQKSVMLGDASALSSPELAGKLPRV